MFKVGYIYRDDDNDTYLLLHATKFCLIYIIKSNVKKNAIYKYPIQILLMCNPKLYAI